MGFSTGVSLIKSGPQAVLGKELCWMETVYCSTACCGSYCFSISRESWLDKFNDYTKRWQVRSSCMSFSFKCVTLLVSGAKPMWLILSFILFQAASSCWSQPTWTTWDCVYFSLSRLRIFFLSEFVSRSSEGAQSC